MVSQWKFDREIAEFKGLSDLYRQQRGWLLVKAEFPNVLVLLAAPKTNPCVLVMGVALDYSNYDASPPSVRLVHALTGTPYKYAELPTRLDRSLAPQAFAPPGAPPGAPQLMIQQAQPYMQPHADESLPPFLCVAGVREYHDHPAHSGDLWELHRKEGHGRLVHILDVITRYGIEPIAGFRVQMQPIVGLNFGAPPE